MLKALERAGYRRESHQTPTEFAAQVARPGVWEITHLYQRTRFGNEGLTDNDVARISVLLGEMKKERIRNKRKGALFVCSVYFRLFRIL
jgi:Domain of unknown function (DUF4129)